MAAEVDASSPARASGNPAGDPGTVTTASFTAPANSLIVACVQGNGDASGTVTYTVRDSGGLTWTKQVERTNAESTAGAESSIWTAVQVTSAARTVSVDRTASGTDRRFDVKVYVVTGADISGTPVDAVGANNEGFSSTNNMTTSSITPGANGLLFASDSEWAGLGSFQASSDLTQNTANYAGEYSVCSGYKAVTSGVAATANLNAAGTGAAHHKWTQIIVREAGGGGGGAIPRGVFGKMLVGPMGGIV